METGSAPRLFLVTPPRLEPESFVDDLAAALAGGDVAAVLIAVETGERDLETVAKALVPAIQAAGAAALVENSTRIAGHAKADGVHIGTTLDDLRLAADSFRPERIVGAGSLTTRHAAMEAGELGVDYVFFGRPKGDTHADPHPQALDLAEWWADLMSVPAVVMAGHNIESLAEAAATGASFVAANRAVWEHPEGPGAAVARATALLRDLERPG
jgi:thiamine-phosphate pyrophosphorylase